MLMIPLTLFAWFAWFAWFACSSSALNPMPNPILNDFQI